MRNPSIENEMVGFGMPLIDEIHDQNVGALILFVFGEERLVSFRG